ncbi:putative membrane-anchored protein [Actinomadura verrucosospora]|uniref:Putative membrane-anchored protein n=1 Tax=Actinomadura verrucosospora TaxID=46165 RepID=A0A7D3VQ08_ACTVE|nr:putative membrane-anchored protein [Actinomadura verrucosospora]
MTALFWGVKILTTGMGETTSDYLAHRLDPVIAVGVAGVLLAVSLASQLAARRYVPWIYWTAVVMVSVFGTMAADVLHVGVPYAVSTAFFAVVLAALFVLWFAVEGTLSIHSVRTVRRELFYWATVMTTFALGTAAGDLTAVTLHLGYLVAGVAFAVLFAIPALGRRVLRLNEVAAFWAAYIVTRPFGASFADWAGVSHARGGLALGTGPVSLALFAVIAALVGYLTAATRRPAH